MSKPDSSIPQGKLGIYLTKIRNTSGEFEILQLLERSLNIYHPEQCEVPIKILGFGEISLVFEIDLPETTKLAFKRLPIFESEPQVQRHIAAYHEYTRLLNDVVHVTVPPSDTAWVYMNEQHTKIALYCIQEKVSTESISNKLIHHLPADQTNLLVLRILREMYKIWDFNRRSGLDDPRIGLDGQISNWAVAEYTPSTVITEHTPLIYLDTSTPMYRIHGEDAMEGKLFLKSAPSFLRWVLKSLLQEVLDRYYDWRSVIIDMIANFYKEQCPELISGVIQVVNTFFTTEAAEFNFASITEKEVSEYYKNDKAIWVLFQNLRRFDRFLKMKVFHQGYDFYLPAKIKR